MKKLFLLLALTISLVGCVRTPLPPHQTSLENVELIRSTTMQPVNVGTFALAPGKPSGMDQSVSARSLTLLSPNQDSFAQYLKESLKTELKTAGKFDEHSSIVITGLLTDNVLDASGIQVGNASLGATFLVHRDSRVVYEKELNENAQWESSFVGAIAIPAARNQYTMLFQKLFKQLFSDEEFKKATGP